MTTKKHGPPDPGPHGSVEAAAPVEIGQLDDVLDGVDPAGHAAFGASGDVDDRAEAPAGVSRALVEAFETELAAARRQADEHWDRYLRAEAELENTRKRAERQRQEALARQRRDLLACVLAVADNLERALAHASADPQSLRAGIEGTYREVERLLEREGVARIAAQGKPFDPNVHEAVGVVAAPGIEGERVVAVELPGYTLDGELLRAARVIVGRPADG